MAGYVILKPFSLKRFVYLDGRQAVIGRALPSSVAIPGPVKFDGRRLAMSFPIELLVWTAIYLP
jgi:hypothetical protein